MIDLFMIMEGMVEASFDFKEVSTTTAKFVVNEENGLTSNDCMLSLKDVSHMGSGLRQKVNCTVKQFIETKVDVDTNVFLAETS